MLSTRRRRYDPDIYDPKFKPLRSWSIVTYIFMYIFLVATIGTIFFPVAVVGGVMGLGAIAILATVVSLGTIWVSEQGKNFFGKGFSILFNLVEKSDDLFKLLPYAAVGLGIFFVITFILNIVGMKKEIASCKRRFISMIVMIVVVIAIVIALLYLRSQSSN